VPPAASDGHGTPIEDLGLRQEECEMDPTPKAITEFLSGKRIAVAGASRDGRQPANAILRRLASTGHEAIPINPNATRLEGVPCYPDLASVPGALDGVVVATHPSVSARVVQQCSERGIGRVWFHRALGAGSVSTEALDACRRLGITPITGGCPLMFCGNVDLGHRCLRWWLGKRSRLPR
jgi:predicted CoA-binding protein